MPKDRHESAYRLRLEAAEVAKTRNHPVHKANPDEERYAAAHYPMSFTKGLEHCSNLGVVLRRADFEDFRTAIDTGTIDDFTTRVRVPQDPNCRRRQWEAPTAGLAYDLQGPDSQAVTMAPAPELCSSELAFEMAEVYELALLRDVPLSDLEDNGGAPVPPVQAAIDRLNAMDYAQAGYRGRPRTRNDAGVLDAQTIFRGSSPGVNAGPYLSQFLWIGTGDPAQGQIGFGAQSIDQRVPVAQPGLDYLQNWEDWLRVQNGFDVNHCGMGLGNEIPCGSGQALSGPNRFIYTPRDLATYVHFDALYQAYLNATLILLGMGTPFDQGFAHLSGMRDLYNPAIGDTMRRNAGGFALFGPPHILTLVTEVATRALKAVRFQKFNNHLRLRPEALAGRIHRATEIDGAYPSTCGAFEKLRGQMQPTVDAIEAFNGAAINNATALLPMAFAEGSPMHPTYGAGHATVAGACTTVVKAFFDTGTVLGTKRSDDACDNGRVGFFHDISEAVQYAPVVAGGAVSDTLGSTRPDCPLTLEGELNKLAANISIGRNMAGVHYYSDYYDSLRMGEEIAIGMLEEQALCYPTDDFVMSLTTFDGNLVRIGRR